MLGLADHQSLLNKMGPVKVSLTKMLSHSHLLTPKVDLTKWALTEISLTKILLYSCSPASEVGLAKMGPKHRQLPMVIGMTG